MHIGFQLQVTVEKDDSLIKIADSLYSDFESTIFESLEPYTNPDGVLNGEEIQKSWFPEVQADVFLSHSRADVDTAKTLAGWIYDNFGLITFIDSCVWNHADTLINAIDRKFCIKPNGYYDYDQRNRSTSHIHMMLSGALGRMLDQSECLFLLNTHNSITPSEVKSETFSPWIYYELLLSQIIQKRDKSYYRKRILKNFAKADSRVTESLQMAHPVNLSHLTILDFDMLQQWKDNKKLHEHPLDTLYAIIAQKGVE